MTDDFDFDFDVDRGRSASRTEAPRAEGPRTPQRNGTRPGAARCSNDDEGDGSSRQRRARRLAGAASSSTRTRTARNGNGNGSRRASAPELIARRPERRRLAQLRRRRLRARQPLPAPRAPRRPSRPSDARARPATSPRRPAAAPPAAPAPSSTSTRSAPASSARTPRSEDVDFESVLATQPQKSGVARRGSAIRHALEGGIQSLRRVGGERIAESRDRVQALQGARPARIPQPAHRGRRRRRQAPSPATARDGSALAARASPSPAHQEAPPPLRPRSASALLGARLDLVFGMMMAVSQDLPALENFAQFDEAQELAWSSTTSGEHDRDPDQQREPDPARLRPDLART